VIDVLTVEQEAKASWVLLPLVESCRHRPVEVGAAVGKAIE
jgi:hypothetical protein